MDGGLPEAAECSLAARLLLFGEYINAGDFSQFQFPSFPRQASRYQYSSLKSTISAIRCIFAMNLANSYLDIPYEQRWEHLKPMMVQIYLEDKATLAQLAQRMVDEFSFKAEYVRLML